MVALSGELQMAFFLAAILTSSMKLWFVLKVFFCMCWCTCGACKGKRKREEPEERLLLQPPRPKSQKQRDAEEDFGKELRKLLEKNNVSAQDSYRILEKAQKCGLEFQIL